MLAQENKAELESFFKEVYSGKTSRRSIGDQLSGELELSKTQKESIRLVKIEISNLHQDFLKKWIRTPDPTVSEKEFELAKTEFRKSVFKARDKIEGYLLPHQMKRLVQLENQERAFGHRPQTLDFGLLMLKDELGISPEQLKQIETVSDANKEEFSKQVQEAILKLRKVRLELRKKSLNCLNEKQRKQFEETYGLEREGYNAPSGWFLNRNR